MDKVSGYQFFDMRTLLSQSVPETEWLVEGMLPRAGLSLICGRPKSGKSTLCRNMMLKVARGEPFLGRRTIAGPVIYLALEEIPSEVKKHFMELGAADDDQIFTHAFPAPEDSIGELAEKLASIKPALLVIDPIGRFLRIPDLNDYAKVSPHFERLLTLARGSGVHVMCVHHSRKGDSNNSDSVLGSTAIVGAVDCTILVNRNSDETRVQTQQRYGRDMPSLALKFDPQNRSFEAGEELRQRATSNLKESILERIQSSPIPVGDSTLKATVSGKGETISRLLQELISEEKIERHGNGIKGSPYVYTSNSIFNSGP